MFHAVDICIILNTPFTNSYCQVQFHERHYIVVVFTWKLESIQSKQGIQLVDFIYRCLSYWKFYDVYLMLYHSCLTTEWKIVCFC